MVEIKEVEQAEAFKISGNSKLVAKDYAGAVSDFTRAIELNEKNHVYYSNRSAALMHLKDYKGALKDAETCIELAPSWGKGYSRKGNALMWLNREGEAEKAFARAKELGYSPPNTIMKSTSPTSSSVILFLARLLMVVFFFSYPFVEVSFRACLITGFCVLVTELYLTHGLPKFSEEYARAIMFDYRLHYATITATFLLAEPFFLGLVLIVASELGYIAEFLDNKVRKYTSFVNLLDKAVTKLSPYICGLSEAEWISIPGESKWAFYNQSAMNFCASVEIVIAFMLLLDLFTPNRNVIVFVLYFQFLRLRYILSPEVQYVCQRIDSRFRYVLIGVPGLGKGYDTISRWVESFASMPKPGQRRFNCTIM